MEALPGLDAACLYLDRPGSPMNIVGTLVLDPSTAPRPFGVDRVRDLVRQRAPALPPLRRRAVPVPYGLGHPVWIEDPRVVAAHAHGPVMAPAALDVTVMSYVDSVDFALLACAERVPHAADLATGWTAAVGDLLRCALEEVPDRERAAFARA